MPEPNIIGGSRVAWTAAVVCTCILLCGLAIIILASFPSGEHGLRESVPVLSFPMFSLGSPRRPGPASADLRAGAGFFSN